MAEEHICTQVGEIASIKTTLKDQGVADNRIEENLKQLTQEVKKNQQDNIKEFGKIDKSLTFLKTSAENTAESLKSLCSDVKEYADSLNNLHARVSTVENNVNNNTKDINRLDGDRIKIADKVDKIEKWMITVISVGTALVLIAEILSHISDIKDLFWPEPQQVQIVNPEPQQQTQVIQTSNN